VDWPGRGPTQAPHATEHELDGGAPAGTNGPPQDGLLETTEVLQELLGSAEVLAGGGEGGAAAERPGRGHTALRSGPGRVFGCSRHHLSTPETYGRRDRARRARNLARKPVRSR
jgi:hypothetical protein